MSCNRCSVTTDKLATAAGVGPDAVEATWGQHRNQPQKCATCGGFLRADGGCCTRCKSITVPSDGETLAHIVKNQRMRFSPLPGGDQEWLNAPELVTFEDGTVGIWKKWGGNDSIAEVFAWEFAERAGLGGLVPETVFCEHRPGTVQRFVDQAELGLELSDEDRNAVMASDEGAKIALLDYLVAQHDRHEANWLYKDGRIVAIDNGMGFSMPATNSPFYRLHQSQAIPKETLAQLESIDEDWLVENFKLMRPTRGSRVVADEMWQRIQRCIELEKIP